MTSLEFIFSFKVILLFSVTLNKSVPFHGYCSQVTSVKLQCKEKWCFKYSFITLQLISSNALRLYAKPTLLLQANKKCIQIFALLRFSLSPLVIIKRVEK